MGFFLTIILSQARKKKSRRGKYLNQAHIFFPLQIFLFHSWNVFHITLIWSIRCLVGSKDEAWLGNSKHITHSESNTSYLFS